VGFPNNLLDSDERIVMHLRPHWKTLVVPVLWLIGIGVLTGAMLAFVDNSTIRTPLLLVAVGLLIWLVVVPILRWFTTHFVLTTHRVMTRKGILRREGRDVPLTRVNDVSFSHTIIERMLGAGTLVVESAGERGQVVLRDIPHCEVVQARLYALVEEDAERRAALHHTPPPSAPHPGVTPPEHHQYPTGGEGHAGPFSS
jgi:uncharacterized membrane protein YdbT with pleckstrin-like domain